MEAIMTPVRKIVNDRTPFMPIAPSGSKRRWALLSIAPTDCIKLPELGDDVTPLSGKLPSLRPRHSKKAKLHETIDISNADVALAMHDAEKNDTCSIFTPRSNRENHNDD